MEDRKTALVIDDDAMQEEGGAPFQRHLQREQENLQRCLASLPPATFADCVDAHLAPQRSSSACDVVACLPVLLRCGETV